MTGGTDGEYPFQTEVPFDFRIQERKDKTATCSIYVDRNVVAGFGIVSIERFVECFYVVIQSCPCNALDRNNTDGVFITHLQCFFRIKGCLFKSQRHFAHFDLPQLGKFFPYYLEAGRNNKIRFVYGFTLSLTFFAPA